MASMVDELLVQALRLTAAEQVHLMQQLLAEMVQNADEMSGLADSDAAQGRGPAGFPVVAPFPAADSHADGRRQLPSLDIPGSVTVPVAVRDLEAITYRIIGCAMQVHSTQGPGLRENSYQRDLETHFTHAGLLYTAQKVLEVYDSLHGGKLIGYYIPDFIVAGSVVVEIKSLSHLDDSHLAQVIGYLAVTGCKVGLLINFGERSLQWRRVLPPKDSAYHQANRRWLVVPDWLNTSPPPSDPPMP
jgi:GxxExxY protein